MLKYIVRRILYAIPILLGVNVIVFVLFFFVSSPDEMAELHLGGKRVTPDSIDNWKRERSLHLPRFLNFGWEQVDAITAYINKEPQKKNDYVKIIPVKSDAYRFILKSPGKKSLIGARSLEIRTENAKIQGSQYSILKKDYVVDDTDTIFDIEIVDKKPGARLKLVFSLEKPGAANRILIQEKQDKRFFATFTDTAFYEKSLKMFWFEFGKSDRGDDIGHAIQQRMWPSLSITIPAFVLAIIVNIFFAMLFAFFRGEYIDVSGVIFAIILMSISSMIYIIYGQFLVGKALKLFPISGFNYGFDSIRFIGLPILLSIIMGFGGSVRFYRTIFLEEINKDYVRTANAKGLRPRAILFIHVLKNAMIPILTNAIVSLPLLLIGSLVLESFFSIPGLGSYLLDGIRQQDFAIVQSMVFLMSFLTIVGLILTDISYSVVDPRVRFK